MWGSLSTPHFMFAHSFTKTALSFLQFLLYMQSQILNESLCTNVCITNLCIHSWCGQDTRTTMVTHERTALLPLKAHTCANDIPGSSGDAAVGRTQISSSFNCGSRFRFSAATVIDEMLSWDRVGLLAMLNWTGEWEWLILKVKMDANCQPVKVMTETRHTQRT
jgi:hypothetical protein